MADAKHERYFKNELSHKSTLNAETATLTQSTRNQLKQLLENLLEDISTSSIVNENHDMSVYTGRAGIALLYFHLYKLEHKIKYLNEALTHIDVCKKKLKGRRVSFLCGDPGILSLSAVIYNEIPSHQIKVSDCISQLLDFLPEIKDLKSSLPDETLYGRSGYLYSLLFVNQHVHGALPGHVILEVWKSILDVGITNTTEEHSSPLMYAWHSKKYVGAAHGLSGILYMLLQVDHQDKRSYIYSHVQPAIDFVLSLQFPSGNFPSSVGNERDRLVHWCHGAPGVIHLMIEAYRTFNDPKYLQSAEKCCKIIWKNGLLRKGYGLCHGSAGNAYAFLAMFQQTKNIEYLEQATQFALWCADYRTRTELNTPDRPFSMFEGLAGTGFFISDILHNHMSAKFPAFCI